jgi:mono/diheme cytochrome c family protein
MKKQFKMKRFDQIKSLGLSGLLICAVILASCNRDNNSTGYAYFPDMAFSKAYETYSPNPNFLDGKTMQPPVPGTVPREMIPYQFAKSFDEQQRAGRELVNPFQPTPEILAMGKEMYTIFCIDCHGASGKGDGHLITSKLFPAQPASLVGEYVHNKPDGELFHVITLGSLSGLMGAHGSQIKPEDRWAIVTYVKNGLGK